ncbi:cation:proton antiporter [Companilactobacillus bobalius]|nr:sodium:proton antiporter [Companilactobacillus bobalius]KAE9558270.1 sodium:proton antiporter [Companilactobacillus bobalius]OVE96897.1 putative Na(+)/H(+) exchanger [Companilactobacillus bobalius]GEO59056.1 sodium:proton antiporter [Companilactobacillus paralimentarius]
MALYESTFAILVAVAFANIISKLVPKVSSTYINLIMGIIFGIIPLTNHMILGFDNEIFMLLIIAPLLFFEGQRTMNFIVWQKYRNIISTAVVLAVIIAAVGMISVNLIMKIGLPLALILAAISTPTDATALESVSAGVTLPKKVNSMLKMESLFNDATGIVLLQAGMIWFHTGTFSFAANTKAFLISGIGGMFFGVIFAFVTMLFRQWLVRTKMNVISSQTLIFILTPFIIYLLSERIGVSGIIAVVSAGLVFNSEIRRSRFTSPRQVHLGVQLINFLNEVLNSFVFVVLGITLERIVVQQKTNLRTSWDWLWIAIIIYVSSLLVRFLYGKYISKLSYYDAVVFSLGGVHGSVTLAMAFSVIGLSIKDNSATFNLIILVESAIIIMSMLVPTFIFKFILKGDKKEDATTKVRRVWQEMVGRGIASIDDFDELNTEVKNSVIYDLKDQLRDNTVKDYLKQWNSVNGSVGIFEKNLHQQEHQVLLHAFNVEQKYLCDVSEQKLLNQDDVDDIFSELLLAESLILDPRNQPEI